MNDENGQPPPSDADGGQPPPSDAYDSQPHTQDFPAYQASAPAAEYPGPPAWEAPAPTGTKLRVRDRVLVTASIVLSLSLALVFALPAMFGNTSTNDEPETLQRVGNAAQSSADQRTGALGSDLRAGAVFLQTNDAKGNEVVAYVRRANGTLREVGRYATGGKGSGSFEDSAQGLVLGSADGETSPTHIIDKAELLFVPNAGSDTISVFRVKADRVELVSETPSGGEKPVSITVSHGLLYVLNSGEFDDRLIIGQTALENCTHGQLPSVTGFRVTPDGSLKQIDGSTRLLTATGESGCSQIAFSPDGKTLVAAERIAGGKKDKATGFAKGALLTYPVYPDGTLGPVQLTEPTGNGPFAFTFTKEGALLVAQQNGGPTNDAGGTVMTYTLNPDGTLAPVGKPVFTSGTDTCWIVVTNDERYAFTTSPLGPGRISTLTVGKDGAMTLLHPVASAPDGRNIANSRSGTFLVDVGLSHDSRYLYAVEALAGDLYAFAVNENGTLAPIDKHHVVNLPSLVDGWQGGPFGIAAY